MFSYLNCKNETMAKKLARKDLTKFLLELLKEQFGEDKVGMVDNNTIGFVFGEVKDKDGYLCDMVATVKPVIKNYQDHNGDKRPSIAYDFYTAKENFENEN